MLARVESLESAIRAASGKDVSPAHFKLDKISVAGEAELREYLSALGSGRFLQFGDELLEKVFDDVPFFQRLRVVVEPGAERPRFTSPATSDKREHPEHPLEASKRIRYDFATHPIRSPSMIAANFEDYYQENYKPRPFPTRSRPSCFRRPCFRMQNLRTE